MILVIIDVSFEHFDVAAQWLVKNVHKVAWNWSSILI